MLDGLVVLRLNCGSLLLNRCGMCEWIECVLYIMMVLWCWCRCVICVVSVLWYGVK